MQLLYTHFRGNTQKIKTEGDGIAADVLALGMYLTGCRKGENGAAEADAEQFLNIIMYEQITPDINDAEDSDSAQVLAETMVGLTRVYGDGTKD